MKSWIVKLDKESEERGVTIRESILKEKLIFKKTIANTLIKKYYR
jgi:hypothetical protein